MVFNMPDVLEIKTVVFDLIESSLLTPHVTTQQFNWDAETRAKEIKKLHEKVRNED